MSEDRWLVITVNAPSETLKEVLAEGLLALGGTAVHEQGSKLTTHIRAPSDVTTWLAEARGTLADFAAGESVDVTWSWQKGEDWAESWKRGLRPRRVGRRFVVTPSWAVPETDPNDLVIVVDPEMAFGTGEHATTRGALRSLEHVIQAGDRVLDVGTGSAILAIGAALLGAQRVVAVDNDPDAILNARDNVERNHVSAVVSLSEAIVDERFLAAAGNASFDVIVANVLSGVLKPLLDSFFEALRTGGHLILGGILEQEADEMLEDCTAAGFRVIAEDLEEEWWGVLLERPPSVSN